MLGKALVNTERAEAFITLKGVDARLERDVTEIARALQSGSLDDLERSSAEGLEGIAIGRELSNQLGAAVGDVVTVLTPHGSLSPMGMLPRTRRLRVVAVFSMGLYELDAAYGFVSLRVAGRLLDRAHPDFIQLRVDDIYAAPDIADEIPRRLGERYLTQDWADMNRSLFSALWLEKMAISITIGLIVTVAALNIVASLVLLVMEKSRDIAILKTMGASAGSVMRIFVLQGLIIGLIGTAVGAAGGLALATVLDRYRLIRLPMDVYQVSYVPFTIQPRDFIIVIVVAVLICLVATIYPSRQASRLDPAEALRYQ